MTPVIAIFDIGKTNKKLLLFDRHYTIVWERSETLADSTDEDGDPCEDLNRLTDWVLHGLNTVLALPPFDVQALNVTSYGASLVFLDVAGQPVGHLYNYLKPFPDHIRARFLRDHGPADALTRQTASPWLGSLNAGLHLYRIKHDKPRLFRQIQHALHLPQYLSYRLNARKLTDLTSLGCHTMLWDFQQNDYADWVRQEQLDTLLAPIVPGDHRMPTHIGGKKRLVGVGLHDSSAALLPYVASGDGSPFVLISTGTWCISLNPFWSQDGTAPALTTDELAHDCLYFLTIEGHPVKASRVFLGHEHDLQTRRLAARFGVADDHYKTVRYDADLASQLQHTDGQQIVLPEDPSADSLPDPSLRFRQRDPAQFASYGAAYHRLLLDLVAGQVASTTRVFSAGAEGRPGATRIFVDGGFSRNPVYMHLLAAAFPQADVRAATVAQATALGAALVMHAAWNPLPIPPDLITLTRYTVAESRSLLL